MPDITRLVLLDHEDLRRQFADLDDAQASGEVSAIEAAWKPLAALLDLHAETEEQVFYPRLLEVGDHAEDETEDAIEDHNKIRDAVRDAGQREVGTDEWWEAVGRRPHREQQAHRGGGARGAARLPPQRRSRHPGSSWASAGSSTAPPTRVSPTSCRRTSRSTSTSPSTTAAGLAPGAAPGADVEAGRRPSGVGGVEVDAGRHHLVDGVEHVGVERDVGRAEQVVELLLRCARRSAST